MYKEYEGVVLDTNVFYSLAQNKYSLDYLRNKYGKLLVSPYSCIEIYASTNSENFLLKQSVAKYFLLVDEMLPYPNEYLTEAWDFENYHSRIPIKEVDLMLNRFLSLKSFEPIKTITENMSRSKNDTCQLALRNMEILIDGLIPGYLEARDKNKMLHPLNSQLADLKQQLLSDEYLELFLLEKYKLALKEYGVIDQPVFLSKNQVLITLRRLEKYLKMFVGLILSSLQRAPRHNDLFDRELTIYLSSKCKFLTQDKLWPTIADEVGLNDSVLYLDPR
jgi:hypothetical protein